MKIALVVPSALKSLPFDMVWSFFHAFAYLELRQDDLPFKINHLEIVAPKEFPIDANRNMAVAQLIEKEFDISVWFDADQTFPRNMIFRLLNNPEPIVSGIYHIKNAPYFPVIYKEADKSKERGTFDWFNPILEYPEDEYFEADMIGMGCVKIDVKVFKEIMKNQVDRDDYEGKSEFFRYGAVPSSIEPDKEIENERVKWRDKYLIRNATEDVFFWRLVRQCTDYRIVVDPQVQCGHITDVISNKSLFESFYGQNMKLLKEKDPEEAKRLKENMCRAEPIKKKS